MDETNLLGILDPLVPTRLEISLEISVGHHLVVDSVAIFLFPDGIEKIKS